VTQLAHSARLAVLWTTGFTFFGDLLQFGLMLVLVRILPAEAYGQFGLTTTLLGFLTLYSFRGFLAHTLQVRAPEHPNFQVHFTAGVVIQAGVFIVANLVAVSLQWFPAYAPVSPLLHVMSFVFLLDLPSELRVKMLERALDWRRLRGLHALALILAAGLSIALAVRGAGVYALLLPILIVPAPFIYDLFVNALWRPTWDWSWTAFRPAWSFGRARIFATSFVSAATLLESTWLTAALGFAAFGVFGRALGLSQLACQRVATLVSTSVYPVLTKIVPRTDAYRKASALLLRSVAWTVVPAAAILGFVATDVVSLLYGDRWAAVVPLLPMAVAGGAVSAVIQPAYTLLLAHDRQDRCLLADIWRLVGTIVILLACLPFGLPAYLAGLAGVHVVSLGLMMHWLERDGAVTWDGIALALVPPLVATLVGAAAITSCLRILPGDAAGIWRILVGTLAFTIAYVGALRLLYRDALLELVGYLPERHRLSRFLLLPNVA
jgi:O-antigen/teichoic acid export membrane protein